MSKRHLEDDMLQDNDMLQMSKTCSRCLFDKKKDILQMSHVPDVKKDMSHAPDVTCSHVFLTSKKTCHMLQMSHAHMSF